MHWFYTENIKSIFSILLKKAGLTILRGNEAPGFIFLFVGNKVPGFNFYK